MNAVERFGKIADFKRRNIGPRAGVSPIVIFSIPIVIFDFLKNLFGRSVGAPFLLRTV